LENIDWGPELIKEGTVRPTEYQWGSSIAYRR